MENSICDQFKDELKTFQEWILTQPQLPQNMSNKIVQGFRSFHTRLFQKTFCSFDTWKFATSIKNVQEDCSA